MKTKLKTRLISMLLLMFMLIELCPAITLPIFAASTFDDMSALDALGIDTSQPSWFDPNDPNNPYGRDNATMAEVDELVILDLRKSSDNMTIIGHNNQLLGNEKSLYDNSQKKTISVNEAPKSIGMSEGNLLIPDGDLKKNDHKKSEVVYTYFEPESKADIGDKTVLVGKQYIRIIGNATSASPYMLQIPIGNSSFRIGNVDDPVTAEGFDNAYAGQQYLKIVCGDFDGDGVDEIAVYVPENNNPRIEIYDIQGDISKGNSDTVVKVYSYPLTPMNDGYGSVPNMVSLNASDFDKDGIDDLAITSGYYGDLLKENTIPESNAVVLFGSKGSTMLQRRSQPIPLKSSGGIKVLRPAMASGDVDGDNTDELVLGGNLESSTAWSRYVAIYKWNGKQFILSQERNFEFYEEDNSTGQRIHSVFDGGRFGAYRSLPVMAANITVGKFNGIENPAAIYLDGLIIDCGDELSISVLLDRYANPENSYAWYYYAEYGVRAVDLNGDGTDTPVLHRIDFNSHDLTGISKSQDLSGDKDNDKYNILFGSGNKLLTSQKITTWLTNVYNAKAITRKYDIDLLAYYMDNNSIKSYQVKDTGGIGFAVANTDDDTSFLTYTGKHYYTYTDPKVLAVLASPPFFKDLANEELGGNSMQSTTTYGTSSGSGTSSSISNTLSVGMYVRFEQTVSFLGLVVSSKEAEMTVKANMTWETINTSMVEQSVSYTTLAGQDTVVFFSIPMEHYEYELITPDGTGNYTKQIMTVNIPHEASVVNLPLDDYERIAADYKELSKISGEILEHTVGIPSSYPNNTSKIKQSSKGLTDYMPLLQSSGNPATTGYGVSAQTKQISMTSGKEDSFTYGVDIETRVGGGGLGLTIGIVAGYEHGSGSVEISTVGSYYEGMVYALPEAAKAYGYSFNWHLVAYPYKDNNSGSLFPIVTYLVTDVTQPPFLPTNFHQEEEFSGSNEIALQWEYTGNPAAFVLYRYFQSAGSSGFYKIDTLYAGDPNVIYKNINNGDGTVTRVYQYIDKGLAADYEYKYQIQTVGQGIPYESIQSPTLLAFTLPEKGLPKVGLNKDTLTAYPDIPNTVQASVTNMDELRNAYGSTVNINGYQWQKQNSSTGAWNNITKATADTLTLENVGLDVEGNYRCRITVRTATNMVSGYSPAVNVVYSKREAVMTNLSVNGDTATVNVSGKGDTNSIPSGTVNFELAASGYIKQYSVELDSAGKGSVKLSAPDGIYKLTAYYGGNRVFKSASVEADDNGTAVFYVVGTSTETYWDYSNSYTYGDDLNILKYTVTNGVISSEPLNYTELTNDKIYITTDMAYTGNGVGYSKTTAAADPTQISEIGSLSHTIIGNDSEGSDLLETIGNRFRTGKASWVGAVKLTLPDSSEIQFDVQPAVINLTYDTTKTPISIAKNEATEAYIGNIRANPKQLLNEIDVNMMKFADDDIFYNDALSGLYTVFTDAIGRVIDVNAYDITTNPIAQGGSFEIKPEVIYNGEIKTEADVQTWIYLRQNCYKITANSAMFYTTGPVSAINIEAELTHGTAKIINPTDGKTAYPYGTNIVIKATPYAGYEIDYWNFNDVRNSDFDGSETYIFVQGTDDVTVEVIFKEKNNTLNYSSTPENPTTNGNPAVNEVFVSPNIENGTPVVVGSTLTFSAQADIGWHFVRWEHRTVGEDPTYANNPNEFIIIMPDASTRVFGVFERDSYNLTLSKGLRATTIVDGEEVTLNIAQPISGDTEITIKPNPGMEIISSSWIANGVSITAGNEYTFTLIEDTEIKADMKTGKYNITAKIDSSSSAMGTISVSIDGEIKTGNNLLNVNGGSEIKFIANPDHGYKLDYWADDSGKLSNSQTYTCTLDKDLDITAFFTSLGEGIDIIVAQPDSGGAITASLNGSTESAVKKFGITDGITGKIYEGDILIITFEPYSGFTLRGWTRIVDNITTYTSTNNLSVEIKHSDFNNSTEIKYEPNIAKVSNSTNAEKPTLNTQPADAEYVRNAMADDMTVSASVKDGGSLSYEWYYSEGENKTGTANAIPDSNSSSYTPPTTEIGTRYYTAKVTNTNDNVTGTKTAEIISKPVKIVVKPAETDKTVEYTATQIDGSPYANGMDGTMSRAIEIKFSDAVESLTFDNIIINDGTGSVICDMNNLSTSDNITWTIPITEVTKQGHIFVDINHCTGYYISTVKQSLIVYTGTQEKYETFYSLNIESDENGSVTGTLNGEYPQDTIIKISAKPNSGYQFKNWVAQGVILLDETNPNISFNMPDNAVNVKAEFEEATMTSPIITTTSLPNGTVDSDYSAKIAVNGEGSISYKIISGKLPDGLTLNASTGNITGKPQNTGTFTFTVEVTNDSNMSNSKELRIIINNADGNNNDNDSWSLFGWIRQLLAPIRVMINNFIAFWESLFTNGRNDKNAQPVEYEVALYKNNELVTSIVTTDTSYDFSREIKNNGSGTYHISVIAVGDGITALNSESVLSDTQLIIVP